MDNVDTDHAIAIERERIAKWHDHAAAVAMTQAAQSVHPVPFVTIGDEHRYAARAIRAGDHWKAS